MAWNPNKPQLSDRIADSIADIRGNFQEIDGLPQVKDALINSRIVEMGSNSNGEYVRWENGLQVCWHVATMARDDDNSQPSRLRYDWTFPASFVAGVIAVGGSVSNASSDWAMNGNVERQLAGPVMPDRVSETSTFFVSWRIDGANWSSGQDVQNCRFWAIGRWK